MVILNEEEQPCFSCTGDPGVVPRRAYSQCHLAMPTQIGRPPLVLSGKDGSGLWGKAQASMVVSGCCTVLSSHIEVELGAPGPDSAKVSSLCLLVEPKDHLNYDRRSRRTLSSRGRCAAAEFAKGWD